MGSKDLDKGDFKGRYFSVHKYSRQVKLHLKTNVDICSIDGRGPPKSKASIRNLRKSRTLSVCQFFAVV